MGQAKNRGNLEERKNQSIEKLKKRLPDFLTCTICGEKVTELSLLPSKGMKGIETACAGICPKCGQQTFGVSGDSESTKKLMSSFSDYASDGFKAGIEDIPYNATNKKSKSSKCEGCGFENDITNTCSGCDMELCSDCHNAHADDIEFNGKCNAELI